MSELEKKVKYVFDGRLLRRVDIVERFVSIFDRKTGRYMRTNVLDDTGRETDKDAFSASFPHLIDVGIMGSCIHGAKGLCVKAGIGCYQSGLNIRKPDMSLADFKRIADECEGYVDQFALGGRGDPDEHADFEEILRYCAQKKISPNFTTSGLGITEEKAKLCREYCGAVAVSWYRSEYTLRAVKIFLNVGVQTNIHFVVSKSTVDEAIRLLQTDSFPKGINAVVFLLHKPTGLGKRDEVLDASSEVVARFVHTALVTPHPYIVAFDSCSVPILQRLLPDLDKNILDTCEGARFSMYVGADMKATPCSFDADGKYAVDIKNQSVYSAWNSPEFAAFRELLHTPCDGCILGCPLFKNVP